MSETEVETALNNKCDSMSNAANLCGVDQGTTYKEMYVGYKATKVNPGQVGCALTCAPYVTLPLKGTTGNGKLKPEDLLETTVEDWVETAGFDYVRYYAPEGTMQGPTKAPIPPS